MFILCMTSFSHRKLLDTTCDIVALTPQISKAVIMERNVSDTKGQSYGLSYPNLSKINVS